MRRVVVGIILAIIGLGSVIVPWAFYVLVLAIGCAAIYELNALCEMKGQPLEFPVAIVGVFGYIILAGFDMLHKWEGVLLAAIVIATFWIGMYGEQKGYFARTAYTLLAVLYIGKLLTYFVFIRQSAESRAGVDVLRRSAHRIDRYRRDARRHADRTSSTYENFAA